MARVTYVKKAQQRFETVTVLNDDGTPKRVPVMARNGQQKVSKRGPVFMTVTQPDRSRPLPNRHCDRCGKEICVGDPYKHISPKSGPYGGRTLFRCGTCPVWHRWEYSYSLSARIEQIQYEAGEQFSQGVESADDVTAILEAAAEEIRGLASEKEEAAQNIEDGFGHPTSASEEIADQAEQLNSWADDVEQTSIEDAPDPDDYVDHEWDPDPDDPASCSWGDVCTRSEEEHEETYEDAMDTWRDEANSALEDALNEAPV